MIKKKENKTNVRLANFISELPDKIIYVISGILIIVEVLERATGWHLLKIGATDYKLIVGLTLIVAVTMTLMKKLNQIKEMFDKVIGKYLGVVEVLAPHENIDFVELLEKHTTIKILTLSGTKTGQLGYTSVMDILKDENRKSNIVLLLADPFSEAIITRYKSDEPDNYEAGVDGIKRRLITLHKLKLSLPPKASDKIEVRIFKNYPSISVIQADNALYSSVYGFKLRGSDCPIIHAESSGDYGKFLINHFNKVYEISITLSDWITQNKIELDEIKK